MQRGEGWKITADAREALRTRKDHVGKRRVVRQNPHAYAKKYSKWKEHEHIHKTMHRHARVGGGRCLDIKAKRRAPQSVPASLAPLL